MYVIYNLLQLILLFPFSAISLEDNKRITPMVQTLDIGDNAIIKCNGTIIKWTHVGQPRLPRNAGTYNNSLEISGVRFDNKGTYECKGLSNNKFTFYSTSLLRIISKLALKTNC